MNTSPDSPKSAFSVTIIEFPNTSFEIKDLKSSPNQVFDS